jgi:hypothetical protein
VGSALGRSPPAASRSPGDALSERAYLCSKMGSRAGRSASGMCSEALLWKLLAEHLGKKRAPKDLTVP